MAACSMKEFHHQHVPVLLEESIRHLVTLPSGIYVDATFGRGHHAQALLNQLDKNGKLFAFDKDPEAVAFGKIKFASEKRFKIFHSSFAQMNQYLIQENVWGKVNGFLFDLGVSSPQLENPDRGFSFTHNGKLDMRMDPTQGIDAKSWLANVTEQELAQVLFEFGEEKFSRRIARAIITARQENEITTTGQLARIVRQAIPKLEKNFPRTKHPATKSFQAIRIAINQELTELTQALPLALEGLAIGGRLAVISFHSLEDRIVKEFIRTAEKGKALPRGLPIKNSFKSRLKSIVKPIKPSSEEINLNPRARSAILRIAEKLP